jgi:hypothetical protein
MDGEGIRTSLAPVTITRLGFKPQANSSTPLKWTKILSESYKLRLSLEVQDLSRRLGNDPNLIYDLSSH